MSALHALSRRAARSGACLAAAVPGAALAAARRPEVAGMLGAQARGAGSPLALGNMLDIGLGLGAVIAAILLLAFLARRFLRVQPGMQGQLRVLAGLSMGARERVVLVQVGATQVLLGVAPGRVQTLHVLEQPVPVPNAGAGAATRESAFAGVLGRVLNARGAGGARNRAAGER